MSQHDDRTKRTKVSARYISIGVIMAEWAFLWLIQQIIPTMFTFGTFLATGFVLTGITIAFIGLRMGKLAREVNEEAVNVPDEPVEKKTVLVQD